MRIAVIDGMGGGLAAQVVSQLTGRLPEQVELIGLGTNAGNGGNAQSRSQTRRYRRKRDLCFGSDGRFDHWTDRDHHT